MNFHKLLPSTLILLTMQLSAAQGFDGDDIGGFKNHVGPGKTGLAEEVSQVQGLCVFFDPSSPVADGKFSVFYEAVATSSSCNLENAIELKGPTSYSDYMGRKHPLAVSFIPRVSLVSEKNCGLGQVQSVVNGEPFLFDSAFKALADDMKQSEYDPRSLESVPSRERSGEIEMVSVTGLSPFEIMGIKSYMGQSYRLWNEALRKNLPIKLKEAAGIRLAASGLSRVVAEGKGYVVRGLVKRRLSMDPKSLANLYEEGRCIKEAGFTSARERFTGDGVNRFGEHSLVIISKTGVLVSALASGRFAEEREVIFRPGTVFRVWNVMPNPEIPNAKKIILEECPCL